jgi:S1-C subfamily serine protease
MVVRSVVDVSMRLATRPGALVFKRATGPSIDMSTDKDDPRAAGTPGNDPAMPGAPVPAADPGAMTGGVRVRFGIAPGDYSGEGGGVEVGEVYPNTSAAEAGIKQGDRITKWNSTMITSVDDWMPMLASAKPGDEVVLQVKRGQEVLEIKAKLRARSGGE